MKRPFYDFVVGDKTVSLKLTSTAMIGIEAKINGSLAMAMAEAPSLTFIALVIEAAAKEKQPDFTMKDALNLIDEFLDEEDHAFMDLVKVNKQILDTSGFFKKQASQTETSK